MTSKYQFDAERWLRSWSARKRFLLADGRDPFAMCADEIHRLRMAVDLHEQGAELMREEMTKSKAELAALKKAAKGLIAVHRRHKDLVVYSEQDYIDIWRERVDALAVLVGEGF